MRGLRRCRGMDWLAHRTTAITLIVLTTVFVAGCANDPPVEYSSNPVLGTWRAEVPTPIGLINLGRWAFTPDQMSAYGHDQSVDYSYSGASVRVIPRDFGLELQLRMVDRNTARLTLPFIGDVVNLQRVE